MPQPFLSAIMIARNNANDILLNLFDLHRHLAHQPYATEIIIVNDGSTDSTAEMLDRYQTLIPELKIIGLEKSRGFGFAAKQGMFVANGRWRALCLAHHYTPIIEFNKVVPHSAAGMEVFSTLDGYFNCFSAAAAERLFPTLPDTDHFARDIARSAKKNGYAIKTI